ncbi:hypothetical protein [Myxococcus sp. RHSTA-1-4]|nr:hypothetical protein [Myxococcus sp. RHSTA-1-4]
MVEALRIEERVGTESFLALLGLAYVGAAALLLYEYVGRLVL